MYKQKPGKSKKSVKISEPAASAPRKAYVEDAPDPDLDGTVAIVEAPPHAPSPPLAAAEPVNVFDFLVNDKTPNASRISLGSPKEQMQMVDHAPPLFEPGREVDDNLRGDDAMEKYVQDYEENAYIHSEEVVPTSEPLSYETPAPKARRNDTHEPVYELDAREIKSTDKKRKRQVEELDLTQARRSSQELDEEMLDADGPPILHSGLTGGLNRLLSKSKFPPSPAYSGGDANEPLQISPVRRTKPLKEKERGRASSALVRVRKVKRVSSDESRPRKHHRPHHHSSSTTPGHHDHDGHTDDHHPTRSLKAIEYPSQSSEDSAKQQLVVYRSRAELFLSFITKGPESESGCSINKALKRDHRERGEQGLGLGKAEEEKELWKSLRVKRNERGEVVLIL